MRICLFYLLASIMIDTLLKLFKKSYQSVNLNTALWICATMNFKKKTPDFKEF